jgi:polyvinyl alcohol dehydrogenase (cytochrome)
MQIARVLILGAVVSTATLFPSRLNETPAAPYMVPPQKKAAKSAASPGSAEWALYGRDLAGSHYNPAEESITPATAPRLKPKWVFQTDRDGGDVSSQPVVVDGVVYFGSWDGKEYSVDATTGSKLWEFDAGVPTRSGAAYSQGTLYFGDAAGRLYALDAKTGKQKWKIRLDKHPAAMATSAPIYHDGRIYIGVSSREELAMMGNQDYECCTFRGSVVALDASSGNEIWRFYTIPEPSVSRGKDKKGRNVMGPSGAAVWSTISIHPADNRLYLTTGNQYTNPETKFSDAIIALELPTGRMIWSFQAMAGDQWNLDCVSHPSDCSEDFDFGSIALSFKGPGGKSLIGAGAKSGWFFALDPATGALAWKKQVGTGGKLGGIEFGTATDGERVYVAISNAGNRVKLGSISALDGATGNILWQTPCPDGGSNFGPITVTGTDDNRLVFAGSSRGFIRAYNALDGKVLWEFDTGGGVGGGPTVVNGVVYLGSGYQNLRIGKPNNKLYAFSVDGK